MPSCVFCGGLLGDRESQTGYCSGCGKPLEEDSDAQRVYLGYDADVYDVQIRGTGRRESCEHVSRAIKETLRARGEGKILLPQKVSKREARALEEFIIPFVTTHAQTSGLLPLANHF